MPERAAAWLRALDPATVDDPLAAACTLGLLAHRTPAWTERYEELLGALAASPDTAAALVAAGLRSLVAGADRPSPTRTLDGFAHAEPWSPSSVVEGVATGLGLLLHDLAHGTGHHGALFDPWWATRPAVPDEVATLVALLLAPQRPDEARALFAGAPQAGAVARLLAAEWRLADVPVDDVPVDDAGAWSVAAELCGAGSWSALFAAPLVAGPRIVGVDTERLVLRRAEWWRGCLLLTLAPTQADPTGSTEFRLVGAEPRMWCQTGIDGAMTDVTGHGMIVRTPLVAGDLEFTPGSY